MKPKVILILVAQVFAIAALEGTTPFLILRFGELGVGDVASRVSWASATMGLSWLFSTLLTPLWGRMSDRVGPAWMLLRAHAGIALGCLAIAFFHDPFAVALARIAQGGLAGVTPAAMACLLEDDDRPRAIAWVQSANALGALLGPLVGAFVVARESVSLLYFFGGGFCLLAAVPLVFVLRNGTPRVAPAAAPMGDVIVQAWPILLLGAWTTCGRSIEDTILVAWADQLPIITTGSKAFWMGLALAAPRLGQLCLQGAWGRWVDRPEHGKWRLLVMALTMAGLLTAMQAGVASFEALTFIRFFIGTVTPGLATTIYSLSLTRTGAARRGECIAWTSTAQRLGTSLGQGASAIIVGVCQVPLGGAFMLAGCGLGLGALVARWAARRPPP